MRTKNSDVLIRRLFLVTLLVFTAANYYLEAVSSQLFFVKYIALFALCIALFFKKNNAMKIHRDVYYCILVLMLTFLLSTLLSQNFFYGITKLIGLLTALITAYLFASYLTKCDQWGMFSSGLLIVAKIVIYSSIAMYFLGLNFGRGGGRFTGWVDNPNTLGMMLLAVFPAVFLAALKDKTIGILSPRFLCSLLLFVAVLTGSRATMFGIVVMTCIIFISQRNLPLKIVLLPLIATPILAFGIMELNWLDGVNNYLAHGATNEGMSLSGREFIWPVAMQWVSEEPWLGHGFAAGELLVQQFSYMFVEAQAGNVHNSYLSLLIDSGYIGLSIFVLILITLLFRAMPAYISAIRADIKYATYAESRVLLTSMLFGFLVHAFFESWLFASGNVDMLLFWVVLFGLSLKDRHKINRA